MRKFIALAAVVLVLAAGVLVWKHLPAQKPVTTTGPYTMSRSTSDNLQQTTVSDSHGHWLATFTNRTRTVRLYGPTRSFAEPQTTTATVTHNTWVRVLDQPFSGTVDQAWLKRELADSSPDILAIAMQYISGAPAIQSGGLTIAGDASYGPLEAGKRKEGSDFNDYLGVTRQYGTVSDSPEPQQLGAMDCSGYMRMVWGYRSGLPLAGPNTPSTPDTIPRRAYQIQAEAPGVVLIPNTQKQVTDFSKLNIGDIVFFDATTSDGLQIDHNGMYMGRDNHGHRRFISSRKLADGPTLGDVGGASILDGRGLYAKAFRSVRRF